MDEGLKIWQEWFEWDGDPWVDDDYGNTDCFFCGEGKPNHILSCAFVKAQALCLPNKACTRQKLESGKNIRFGVPRFCGLRKPFGGSPRRSNVKRKYAIAYCDGYYIEENGRGILDLAHTQDQKFAIFVRDALNAAQQSVQAALCCEVEGCKEPAVMFYCEGHAP